MKERERERERDREKDQSSKCTDSCHYFELSLGPAPVLRENYGIFQFNLKKIAISIDSF